MPCQVTPCRRRQKTPAHGSIASHSFSPRRQAASKSSITLTHRAVGLGAVAEINPLEIIICAAIICFKLSDRDGMIIIEPDAGAKRLSWPAKRCHHEEKISEAKRGQWSSSCRHQALLLSDADESSRAMRLFHLVPMSSINAGNSPKEKCRIDRQARFPREIMYRFSGHFYLNAAIDIGKKCCLQSSAVASKALIIVRK